MNSIYKRKALLIGDYTHPKFHPLQGVDEEITRILQGQFAVQCTENKHMLEKEHVEAYDLCISYHDTWMEKLSSKQTGGLLSFVSEGGGLLVIHNGIVLNRKYELAQMIGARSTVNKTIHKLKMRIAAPEHDVMKNIEPFEIMDEPYWFEFDRFMDTTILMEYGVEGEWLPAAWAHQYGMGRVVYLMPGRDQTAFQHHVYSTVVLQAAKWAARVPG